MADDNLYLQPKRRVAWGWLVLGIAGLALLAAGGLALGLGVRHLKTPAASRQPAATLVPTFTPRPKVTETPEIVTLVVRPWTDDSGPVGLVEVTLSLPAAAQVSHRLPPGFRYWRGDLVPTRQGMGWSGSDPGEVRWYLLREPGIPLPASLEVTVNGQVLALTLQPARPASTSAPLE